MNEAGVIVGRFQTPFLTEGHRYLIDEVRSRHKRVIIMLGMTRGLATERNPLDFTCREQMIRSAYPDVHICGLYDHPSDAQWSKSLDEIIDLYSEEEKAILYGSRDSFIDCYTGKYPTCRIDTPHKVSATEIRKHVSRSYVNSDDFRSGIIHALSNRHPSPFLTVDIAMLRFIPGTGSEILMAKKQGEDQCRFIGGFVDSSDGSITRSAQRELYEETGGGILARDFRLIGEARINDWRYKNDRENIFTCFFTCEYVSGEIKASDDIVDLQWIRLSDLKAITIMPEHEKLKQILIKHLAL